MFTSSVALLLVFLYYFVNSLFYVTQIQVRAKDDNGLVSQRYLLIEVCDRDDNEPEFPSYPNGTVIDFLFTIEEGMTHCCGVNYSPNAQKITSLHTAHSCLMVYVLSCFMFFL